MYVLHDMLTILTDESNVVHDMLMDYLNLGFPVTIFCVAILIFSHLEERKERGE